MALLRLLSLASLAAAHFTLNTPTAIGKGSNINAEDQSPCGGFTPSASDTITDFHVGGDAIGLISLHAQSYFAFLGILGTDVSSSNWTFLVPTVEEYGLNGFCEPSVPAPSSWVGQEGVLQVVQDSEDGIHYQCMHVNFVNGTGSLDSSTCYNSSGVSADFASTSDFQTIDGMSAATATATGTTAANATATATGAATTSSVSAGSRMVAVDGAMAGVMVAGVLAVLNGLL